MKKFIAGIFLLIFSFQILPVKELGKMLFKNQLTEEIKETCDTDVEDAESLKLKKEADPFHPSTSHSEYVARIQFLSHSLQTALHQAERLPIPHVADIFTPPPNC
jgi:hypothetical protein